MKCPICNKEEYRPSEIEGCAEHGYKRTLHILFCSNCGFWAPCNDNYESDYVFYRKEYDKVVLARD